MRAEASFTKPFARFRAGPQLLGTVGHRRRRECATTLRLKSKLVLPRICVSHSQVVGRCASPMHAPFASNVAAGLLCRLVRAEAKPMAPTTRNRSPWCTTQPRSHRGEADGPTALKRSPWFPMQPHPRRTQCGVGADECFVTYAECASAPIPDAPLPQLRWGPA